MKLYTSKFSPFGRKVYLWSCLLGCEKKIEFLDLSKTGVFTLPDNYEKINPLRKIPALVTEDNKTFVDSPLICDYLSRRFGQKKFFDQNQELLNLQFESIADGGCDAAVLRRMEMIREPHLQSTAAANHQLLKINNSLQFFEARSAQLKNPYDRAELALMCLLGYLDFRFPEMNWRADFPRLMSWYNHCLNWEPFHKTIP